MKQFLLCLSILILSACGGSGGSSSSDRNQDREVVDSGVDGETGATQFVPNVIEELQGQWVRGCTPSPNTPLYMMLFGANYSTSSLSVEGTKLRLSYYAYMDRDCALSDDSGFRVTDPVEYIGETTLNDGSEASVISLQVAEGFVIDFLIRVDGDTLYVQDFENDNALNYDDPFYRK